MPFQRRAVAAHASRYGSCDRKSRDGRQTERFLLALFVAGPRGNHPPEPDYPLVPAVDRFKAALLRLADENEIVGIEGVGLYAERFARPRNRPIEGISIERFNQEKPSEDTFRTSAHRLFLRGNGCCVVFDGHELHVHDPVDFRQGTNHFLPFLTEQTIWRGVLESRDGNVAAVSG